MIGWYNDPITSPYDHTVVGEVGYNNLGAYTIQANPAAGGSASRSPAWARSSSVREDWSEDPSIG